MPPSARGVRTKKFLLLCPLRLQTGKLRHFGSTIRGVTCFVRFFPKSLLVERGYGLTAPLLEHLHVLLPS